MSDKEGGLSKLFDGLAKLVAIVVLLAIGLQAIFALLAHFSVDISSVSDTITGIAAVVLQWAALVLAGLVAMEFATKHNFIVFIIVAAILALAIIAMFFMADFQAFLG